MAKNHVANSRGNPFQQDVVGILRALGHVTYDFLSSTYKCNFLGADNKQ